VGLAPLLPAAELWTTEAVLIEIGNAFGARNRQAAVDFVRQFYRTPNAHVVPVTTDLLSRALALYESHRDKTWGLADCISFTVMREQGLTDALTADAHFVQAGFRALLRP
jgi:hypothetical protein